MTRFVGTEVTSERLHDQVCGYRKSPVRGYMTRFVFSVLLIGYLTFFGNVQTQRLHDQICGYRKSQLRGYMTSFLATAKLLLRGYITSFGGYRKSPLRGYITSFFLYRSQHSEVTLTDLWVQNVTTKRLHDQLFGYRSHRSEVTWPVFFIQKSRRSEVT